MIKEGWGLKGLIVKLNFGIASIRYAYSIYNSEERGWLSDKDYMITMY